MPILKCLRHYNFSGGNYGSITEKRVDILSTFIFRDDDIAEKGKETSPAMSKHSNTTSHLELKNANRKPERSSASLRAEQTAYWGNCIKLQRSFASLPGSPDEVVE